MNTYIYIYNPVINWLMSSLIAKRIGPLDKAGRASVTIRVAVYSFLGQWGRFSALTAITQTTLNIIGDIIIYTSLK